MLNEKSVSRTQQRLMGQAEGVRKFLDSKGKEGIDPKDLKAEYKDTIVKLAKDMSKKALHDFAATKHKNLPEDVDESFGETGNKGDVPTIYPYLNPDSKKSKKDKSAKMQNLADYREFINSKKSE